MSTDDTADYDKRMNTLIWILGSESNNPVWHLMNDSQKIELERLTRTRQAPQSSEERLREKIADICKLHGVPEATYWNIADETLAVVKAELGAARVDELERFYNQNRYPVATKVIFNEYYAERTAELRNHFGIGEEQA